jgi:hypothetical protein
MPYEFDWEIRDLIVEIRGLRKDLLKLELGFLEGERFTHMVDYLATDCILQANEIQHELLDIRLALLFEEDLSRLIRPVFPTPRYYLLFDYLIFDE